MIDLHGRSALVTGSTSGIGEAIARGLAAVGAEVVVNGRSPETVERVAKELGVRGVAGDIGTAVGAAGILDRLPDVDILVNSAGVFETQPVFEITDEDWMRLFEVNVLSGVRLTRHYTPRMVNRGWGRVVFVSSEAGIQTPTEMVHYGVTKSAQLAVSRGIAQEVAGTGVTVNCVLPGPTLTEGVQSMLSRLYPELPDDERERRYVSTGRASASLLKRLIRPEEIANIVTYVASEQASATTGAALSVDGGMVPTIFP
ncbi:SDR family NAD(P)-dependent oxidoreductase [Streptomyces sp. NPDC001068]|uniref:SDR family NAD(P)-dependent oxidoreductase n=1 Tax=Streptomyces sp. NPDC001068 TaxID=3364544 RepID=UPI00367C451E